MSEQIVKQEFFEYEKNEPFNVILATGDRAHIEKLLPHWHPEIEIMLSIRGKTRNFINGQLVDVMPGDIVVTNSECIHSIMTYPAGAVKDYWVKNIDDIEETGEAIVIIISRNFMEEAFPDYGRMVFTNDNIKASQEVIDTILELYRTEMKIKEKGEEDFAYLHRKALIHEILYLLSLKGMKKNNDDINVLKNIERIKGVTSYVSNHYMEPLTQAEIAKKFYFSTVYFSRFFKRCTGETFTAYLTSYRLQKAREDLENTTDSVSDIALKNGFSDDRRLIIAFKKEYGITPLQYRKKHKNDRILR